jgi:anti-sigma B factor antagonist
MEAQPHVVTRLEKEGTVVLGLVGEFDLALVDLVRDSLEKALEMDPPRIVVDLSKTHFLDSVALGAVVVAGRDAKNADGWLRLVSPPANVRKLLRITQIDTVFGLYDTVAQAIEHEDGA